jgi:hypothetical protein
MAALAMAVEHGEPNPLERKGVSTMADLTIATLQKLIHELPTNTKLMVRLVNGTSAETVEVGLIAYTADSELIFLAAPDV